MLEMSRKLESSGLQLELSLEKDAQTNSCYFDSFVEWIPEPIAFITRHLNMSSSMFLSIVFVIL